MTKRMQYISVAAVAIAISGVSFFGGMQYQMRSGFAGAGAQVAGRAGGGFGGGGGSLNGGGATGPSGQTAQGNQLRERSGQAGGMNAGMRPVSGEIISQDETSMTVKMEDGSTKIIILSEKTTINKTSEAAKTDVKVGEQVTVFGTQNQDGTFTAQNVAIGGMMQTGGQPTVSSSPTPAE